MQTYAANAQKRQGDDRFAIEMIYRLIDWSIVFAIVLQTGSKDRYDA